MSDPRGYDDDMFDRHIDIIADRVLHLPGIWRVERWHLVDALLDHRLAFTELESRMVVDWLLVNLVTNNGHVLIPRKLIHDTLEELRIA